MKAGIIRYDDGQSSFASGIYFCVHPLGMTSVHDVQKTQKLTMKLIAKVVNNDRKWVKANKLKFADIEPNWGAQRSAEA